jgi:hypothetical protein
MLFAAIALLIGLWAGLVRIGWQLPPFQVAMHGQLMISGFLGTLISLERAVALQKRLPYLAPALTAAGTASLIIGLPDVIVHGLILLGSLVLLISFSVVYYQHFKLNLEWASIALIIGSLSWVVGNVLWLAGFPLSRIAPWWVGFLVITIAGERLELSRVVMLKRSSIIAFVISASIFIVGLIVSLFAFQPGIQIGGAGLIALGLWLLRFDVARKTIRQTGLTRFVAACLLPGYIWIIAAGASWIIWSGYFRAGAIYDVMLHTALLGFVFSMIFGHAPIIVPALLGIQIQYQSKFYVPLVLLHASLIVRVVGGIIVDPTLRAWGGLLNEIAIILFLGLMVRAATQKAESSR